MGKKPAGRFRKRYIGVGDIRITEKGKKLINEVLDNNRLSYGPMSRKFEQNFAKLHDSKFAIFTNSGTSSLHIALAALMEKHGFSYGDEVIVPSVTFVATSNVVIHNGMKPVFADVDANTFNIDPQRIEEQITDKTKAIVPVHLLGLPADMDEIKAIAKKYHLRIIEDSAETMFATYKGSHVGSFGDVGCFSTYIAHYIVTGIGGLTTTSDTDLAIRLRSLMNHGRDSIYMNIDDSKTDDERKLREVVKRRFNFVSIGHSFRATEMEAALGLSQLSVWKSIVARRKLIASKYLRGLNDLQPYIRFQHTPKDRDNVYMMFGIVCREKDYKRDLINFLEESAIETRDLLPLLNQPVYRKMFGNIESDYPVAKQLNEAGFYIGSHQYITNDEVSYVIGKFHEFFKR